MFTQRCARRACTQEAPAAGGSSGSRRRSSSQIFRFVRLGQSEPGFVAGASKATRGETFTKHKGIPTQGEEDSAPVAGQPAFRSDTISRMPYANAVCECDMWYTQCTQPRTPPSVCCLATDFPASTRMAHSSIYMWRHRRRVNL